MINGEGTPFPGKEENMGRYVYTWRVRFYGSGGWVNDLVVEAKTRQAAIDEVKKRGYRIVEIICCVRVDRW